MEEAPPPQTPPQSPKKGKGRLIGILIALALVLAAGVAGAVFAPRFLNNASSEKADSNEGKQSESGEGSEASQNAEAGEEDGADPAGSDASAQPVRQRAGDSASLTELAPMVIDSRATDGSVRHVKVVLVIEHPEDYKPDEFKRFIPFAREAAIAYLRTREFEQLADPKNFDLLRKQLALEIIGAVGPKQASRVLITDYVVQ